MTMQSQNNIFSTKLAGRGFMPLYYAGEINHCPGCGSMHWHVGRMTAECAQCETALPIALAATQGYGEIATLAA